MARPSESPPRTVWEIYNEKAKIRDKALLKDWDSSINSLLLFSALFAAVLTAICVESRKLLEPDPSDVIRDAILYMSNRQFDANTPLPPSKADFNAPDWAIIVNGFFFTSLTISILAAVGAVTCLQWVGEYDAGLEAASTPENRALRWHYRYQATRKWYMPHMIAFLPILLYLAVCFFFVGLTVWFRQFHHQLAAIPLAGLLIWSFGYAFTTILAVLCPSAPYRTAASKATFRVLYLTIFYSWKWLQTAVILSKPLIKFLLHFNMTWEYTWNVYRNEFILEKIKLSRHMKGTLAERYPWMPLGRDSWQAMHSHVWEQGRVARDDTLRLSTIAWLANSIDLSKHSISDFYVLLNELNQLEEKQLQDWPAYNYDAPWSYIFNMVLRTPQEPPVAAHEDMIKILTQILLKMSLHPTLFERMVQELDEELLIAFMDLMAFEGPRVKDEDADKAKRRLESVTCLLASKRWEEMGAPKQPVMAALKGILDSLNRMRGNIDDTAAMTSWIFTLCHVNEAECEDRIESTAPSWPNPDLIHFIPGAFSIQDLREHAIVHYLQFADTILCNSSPPITTANGWRWSTKGVSLSDTQNQLILLEILGDHLLPIFLSVSDPSEQRLYQDRFNMLLREEKLSSPALRLLTMAFGRYRQKLDIPSKADALWQDKLWRYSISVWYKVHTHCFISAETEQPTSPFLAMSAEIMSRSEDARSIALDALTTLASSSSMPLQVWLNFFKSIQEGDIDTIQAISSRMVNLPSKLWLSIFTCLEEEGSQPSLPANGQPIQAARHFKHTAFTEVMMSALRDSLLQNEFQQPPQEQLVGEKWRDAAARVLAQNPIARSRFWSILYDIFFPRLSRAPKCPPAYRVLLLISKSIPSHRAHAASDPGEVPRLAHLVVIIQLAREYFSRGLKDDEYSKLFSRIALQLQNTGKLHLGPAEQTQCVIGKAISTNTGLLMQPNATTDLLDAGSEGSNQPPGDPSQDTVDETTGSTQKDPIMRSTAPFSNGASDTRPKEAGHSLSHIPPDDAVRSASNGPRTGTLGRAATWPSCLHAAYEAAHLACGGIGVNGSPTMSTLTGASISFIQAPNSPGLVLDNSQESNWLVELVRRFIHRHFQTPP